MKKALIFIILLLFGVNSFAARTVFCVNCSNQFIQLLDRITNLEQLAVLNKQYGESVIQTKKQIEILLVLATALIILLIKGSTTC